ncbi:alpha-mannosidase [Saccharibacillus alkalitolerans]|uniref:Alpha-mannosidase n=1 Tax=Saccharibacillus alkalitolerans TaxID=2705290 RepID=A0ABX0F464_9BACL|nr:alpha-mannosidase [Saccharibacillus alkalitolerans]NGZ74418.1 alpha-mannosidase [Saccharibacillus alkalitolerans]
MFKTEEKLRARLTELETLRHRTLHAFGELDTLPDEDGAISAAPPADAADWKSVPIGERWAGRDRYLWLRLSAELPEVPKGHRLVGLFDFGTTPHGNSRGFESLLFVNGSPRQGVDSNHKEVFLDDLAGGTAKLHFRLWSGLEGGGPPTAQEHVLARAEISLLHEAADDLYYTGRAMLDTALILQDSRAERDELLLALNRSLLLLDWSRPGSDDFYASAQTALSELKRRLDGLRADYPQPADPVTVRCVGHTHIDVAWLWRLRHTREKAARSFSTVLELMEHYPDYMFLQTQPQLYAYIKHDYPELYARIRERVAEGRWEAGGAMWLEADCNLTSGESLVRQILRGTQFFREEFGTENRYLWLPDVFGYSWALPQILRKSGITSFMTTKISWSQYNRMPHDTFVWKGIDGSEVLTHFITTPEIEFPQETYYTYNGYVVPETVQGIWEQYKDRSFNRELLLCYGYGDGGGGVNRDMLEMRRRLEHMPGLPKTITGRADDYFERLERTAAETESYVHTWDGELYLENHRGTYTSQAWIKKANRRLELALRRSEMLNVAAGLLGDHESEAGQRRLNEAWKIALRNQFHDIIPGSSIGEVYDDARGEYAEAGLLTLTADAASLAALTGGKAEEEAGGQTAARAYTMFNDSSWACEGAAEIPGERESEANPPHVSGSSAASASAGGTWRTADGRELTAQRTSSGWLVETGGIAALGFAEIAFEPDPAGAGRSGSADASDDGRFVWKDGRLETPFYLVEWDEAGRLSRLYDREHRREVLAAGEAGNVLQVFEDKPLQFDAWNIDLFYTENMRTVDRLRFMRLKENGPLRASVEFEWAYGDSRIRQEVRLYSGSRRIDFCTNIDWKERRQLLKVAFPVDIRATEASYDIQFGSVKRPTHWNTSWDYARFETVGHQWADLSERGYGVSLLNDCKYGYDVKGNTLRLSLIKSAEYPDPQADLGEHAFTYSLFPHAGDWAEGGTAREAWNLNSPPGVWEGASGLDGRSLLRSSAEHVAIDAVKIAEDGDGIVVRVHECEGRSGETELTSFAGPIRWQETDLLERALGEERSGAWRFHIKPYEIRTYRIRFGEQEPGAAEAPGEEDGSGIAGKGVGGDE